MRKLAIASALVALSFAFSGPAWASPPTVGTGTRTVEQFTITSFGEADGNQFITGVETGHLTGAVQGEFTAPIVIVIHPNGTEDFRGTDICTCTVEGVTGPYQDFFVGRGIAGGDFRGSVVIGGTGNLTNLHGQGTFQGSGNVLTYFVELHFDP